MTFSLFAAEDCKMQLFPQSHWNKSMKSSLEPAAFLPRFATFFACSRSQFKMNETDSYCQDGSPYHNHHCSYPDSTKGLRLHHYILDSRLSRPYESECTALQFNKMPQRQRHLGVPQPLRLRPQVEVFSITSNSSDLQLHFIHFTEVCPTFQEMASKLRGDFRPVR